jgi:hypothetical protein
MEVYKRRSYFHLRKNQQKKILAFMTVYGGLWLFNGGCRMIKGRRFPKGQMAIGFLKRS